MKNIINLTAAELRQGKRQTFKATPVITVELIFRHYYHVRSYSSIDNKTVSLTSFSRLADAQKWFKELVFKHSQDHNLDRFLKVQSRLKVRYGNGNYIETMKNGEPTKFKRLETAAWNKYVLAK